MRIIFFLIFFLFCYAFLKSLTRSIFFGGGERRRVGKRRDREEERPLAYDELVKDPVCGVYIAKRDAIRLKYKGSILYFCSISCRDEFLKGNKG